MKNGIINRYQKNKSKYSSWEDYKKHLIGRLNKDNLGVFSDIDVCCFCGASVKEHFDLVIHHTSYEPKRTILVHSFCHGRSYKAFCDFRELEKQIRVKVNRSLSDF